jgi:hypothetical protein
MQRKGALGAQRDSCAGAPTGFRRLTTQPIAGDSCGRGRIYSFKLAAAEHCRLRALRILALHPSTLLVLLPRVVRRYRRERALSGLTRVTPAATD